MNKDSYHSMKRGLALSLVIHGILLSWASVHFISAVSLPQQLEAIPITLAPVTQELSSQQGAVDAPVGAVPAIKPTTKPQEKEDARYFGEGKLDSLAPFKPNEKPRLVDTTPPPPGKEDVPEKSSPELIEQEFSQAKTEMPPKIEPPQEEAPKVLPDAPLEMPQEEAPKVLPDAPLETPQEEAPKVLPDAPLETPQEEAPKVLPDAPLETPQEEAPKVLPDAPLETPQGEAPKVLPDAPLETPQEEAPKVLPDAPLETPQEEAPKVLPDAPLETLQEEAPKVLPDAPLETLQEEAPKVLPDAPLETLQEEAPKVLPDAPLETPQEEAPKVLPDAPLEMRKNEKRTLPQEPALTIPKASIEQAPARPQTPQITLPDKFPLPHFKPKSDKKPAFQNVQATKKNNQHMESETIEDILAMEENNLLNRARTQGGGAKRSTTPEALGARKNINDTTKMAQTLVSIVGGCIQQKLKLVALGGDLKNRPAVRLRFYLNREGMVVGDPIIDPLSGAQSQKAIMVRQVYAAVFSCQPYADLPRDQYDLWGQGFDFNVDPLQEITQ
ncbi:cell envelope biogenesis protein TolA [Bartonella harrusi]|uniref:Cell envelope biogenesis protein TolA n=1 Tax=Bartonella harrusi TaxID=2961895 RepID=A0ABY5EW37_9HYPH|nr:cell envelope biogenesis protein TolA [Bartonella harrusi]UTO28220.1 cell envelope biogenesis protein TolA [Bartonella harrusi]